MKSYYRMVKPWDIILTVLLVLLSFLPFVVFSYMQAGKTEVNSTYVAIISVDNEPVREITLTGHTGTEEFEVRDSHGDWNVIQVVDNRIRIRSANCKDQVCVLTGFISKPGETIVCLPHKVIVEIQTIDGGTEDIIISQ